MISENSFAEYELLNKEGMPISDEENIYKYLTEKGIAETGFFELK